MNGGVLGIDPGVAKVGFALVDDAGRAIVAGIEPVEGLTRRIAALVAAHPIRALAVGRGTRSAAVGRALEEFGLPIHFVDEYETSRRARELYFAENPPRGWRRLVPVGLLLPPRPIDDYAAVLIARRYLAREQSEPSPN